MSKIISVEQAILLIKNTKRSDCLSVLAARIPSFLTEVSLRQIREILHSFRHEDNRLQCFELIAQNFPGIEGDLDSVISSAFKTEALKERAFELLKEHNI